MRPSLRRSTTSSAAVPAMFTNDVASGIPQMPSGENATSSSRVEEEVAERDGRRHPVVLQAEERAVQHQHRPVERQPEAERGEARGDRGRLGRGERAALVDQAGDRLGQHCGDDARRHEQERDLPEPERARAPEAVQVVPRREARERREEHGRDRDGEHALRQHVDAERRIDRRRGVLADQPAADHAVDERVDVDQAEPERDRQHHLEDALDGRVAPVDHHLQPAVPPAQPGERQQELHDRPERGSTRRRRRACCRCRRRAARRTRAPR